jgi:hypothetical protein
MKANSIDGTPQVPTPTISVQDFVANPEHIKNCLLINPNRTDRQFGYLDVFPGTSSADDVRNLLGEPIHIINAGAETNWYYDNNPTNVVSITIINGEVDGIGISNYDTSITLNRTIREYGCPSLVRVIDRSEHSAGNYNATVFCYPEIGVEFWFDGILIALNSSPVEIRYFKPSSLEEYIQINSEFLYIDSPVSEPVYWADVVIDK